METHRSRVLRMVRLFNGDPGDGESVAADAIDKVPRSTSRRINRNFTCADDGTKRPHQPQTEKDKKNAASGRQTMAAGTKDRYDGQFNINKWAAATIGMAINNTNRQGFSIMGYAQLHRPVKAHDEWRWCIDRHR